MSSAVKAVSSAVGGVVKSVANVVSGAVKAVTNTVKKVADSKIGKAVTIAAAVYFGGAALAGGFSSSAAGGGFLSGMGTGVANAAEGLSLAWKSALAGDFSGASSALSSGFQGQAGAQAGVTNITNGMSQSQMLAVQNAGIPGATQMTNAAAKTAFPAAGSTALQLTPGAAPGAAGGSIADALIGAAKIQAGTQLAGGLIQGYAQQKALEEQRQYEVDQQQLARDRYNQNVGVNWWPSTDAPAGVASAPAPAPAPATGATPAPTGLVTGAMNQSYKDYMDRVLKGYNPYALRTA